MLSEDLSVYVEHAPRDGFAPMRTAEEEDPLDCDLGNIELRMRNQHPVYPEVRAFVPNEIVAAIPRIPGEREWAAYREASDHAQRVAEDLLLPVSRGEDHSAVFSTPERPQTRHGIVARPDFPTFPLFGAVADFMARQSRSEAEDPNRKVRTVACGPADQCGPGLDRATNSKLAAQAHAGPTYPDRVARTLREHSADVADGPTPYSLAHLSDGGHQARAAAGSAAPRFAERVAATFASGAHVGFAQRHEPEDLRHLADRSAKTARDVLRFAPIPIAAPRAAGGGQPDLSAAMVATRRAPPAPLPPPARAPDFSALRVAPAAYAAPRVDTQPHAAGVVAHATADVARVGGGGGDAAAAAVGARATEDARPGLVVAAPSAPAALEAAVAAAKQQDGDKDAARSRANPPATGAPLRASRVVDRLDPDAGRRAPNPGGALHGAQRASAVPRAPRRVRIPEYEQQPQDAPPHKALRRAEQAVALSDRRADARSADPLRYAATAAHGLQDSQELRPRLRR